MEKPKQRIELSEWLQSIINITSLPCYLLLRIDEDGKINLESLSTTKEAMEITEGAKLNIPNYMG